MFILILQLEYITTFHLSLLSAKSDHTAICHSPSAIRHPLTSLLTVSIHVLSFQNQWPVLHGKKQKRQLYQLEYEAYIVSFAFSLTDLTHLQSYVGQYFPVPLPLLVKFFHTLGIQLDYFGIFYIPS